MNVNYKSVNNKERFTDSDRISLWAKTAVEKLQSLGIMEAKSDKRFDPKGVVTRADFATVLRKFIEAGLTD